MAVAVVSESFARTVFGSSDAIGRTLPLGRPTVVVGVVGDLRYNGLDKQASPAVYLPMAQHPRPLVTLVARLRPGIGRALVVNDIRRVLREIDPAIPPVNVAMVDQVVDDTIAGRRFYSIAAGAFAAISLMLTTIGLALVVARAVAERQRELAIRSALGATVIQIARVALGDAMIAIASGTGVGLLLASVGSVLIEQFMFGITARSANVYALAAMIVLGVAAGAASMTVRRFARLPLAEVLRQE